MRLPVRAVTLDFGGTLDGPDHWRDRFWRVYDAAGLHPEKEDFERAFGFATRAAYAEPRLRTVGLVGLVRFHVQEQMRELGWPTSNAVEDIVHRFVQDTRKALHRHAALVRRWKERVRLGVISNFYGNLAAILAEEGLASLFPVVIDSALVGMRKPERAIFELACAQLECEPEEVLHVGDSLEHDVLGACGAGMYAAWLNSRAGRDAGCSLPATAFPIARLADLDECLSCKPQ
ncbi:MAG: HAD family hydrolase [Candidatus Binatia bacterium]|nr:HAD family hydrolase [Candidatus Binatia bacterium]